MYILYSNSQILEILKRSILSVVCDIIGIF